MHPEGRKIMILAGLIAMSAGSSGATDWDLEIPLRAGSAADDTTRVVGEWVGPASADIAKVKTNLTG